MLPSFGEIRQFPIPDANVILLVRIVGTYSREECLGLISVEMNYIDSVRVTIAKGIERESLTFCLVGIYHFVEDDWNISLVECTSNCPSAGSQSKLTCEKAGKIHTKL